MPPKDKKTSKAKAYAEKKAELSQKVQPSQPAPPSPSQPASDGMMDTGTGMGSPFKFQMLPGDAEFMTKRLEMNSSDPTSMNGNWLGHVNIKHKPLTPFIRTLRDLNDPKANDKNDEEYHHESESRSSIDSDASVVIPLDEFKYLKDMLFFLKPPDQKSAKSTNTATMVTRSMCPKRQKIDSEGEGVEVVASFTFLEGRVTIHDWPRLRDILHVHPDLLDETDSSPDYKPEHPVENKDEEEVQEEDADINEAATELFSLLAGQLLSTPQECDRYRWFEQAFKKSRDRLSEVFKNFKSPPFLASPAGRNMFVSNLRRLHKEGKEYNRSGAEIRSTINGKINLEFMNLKSSKATIIKFDTKEEFVIFVLYVFGDGIHDAKRLEDKELRTKTINFKTACAKNLVFKMYGSSKVPNEVNKLLNIIIENSDSDYETRLMNYFSDYSQCIRMDGFSLTDELERNRTRTFTDNASMSSSVNVTNTEISIQTMADAGASNRGNLCVCNPINLCILWESVPNAEKNGRPFLKFHMYQNVSKPETREHECEYYANDYIRELIWQRDEDTKIHRKSDIQRLPICTLRGEMNGCLRTIMLNAVAKSLWVRVIQSIGEPDGLNVVTGMSFKFQGDAGMGFQAAVGHTNIRGFVNNERKIRRLPYIVSSDSCEFSGIHLDFAFCNKYNNAVKKQNNGNVLSPDETRVIHEFLDHITMQNALIGNDRSAHGFVMFVLGAMLKRRQIYPTEGTPINLNCKSILVCTGMEKVDVRENRLIRWMNREVIEPKHKSKITQPGVWVDSSEGESQQSDSCKSDVTNTSYVGALSAYFTKPTAHPDPPDTIGAFMREEDSPSPPVSRDVIPQLLNFGQITQYSMQDAFLLFLKNMNMDILSEAIKRIQIPNTEFGDSQLLAVRINATMTSSQQPVSVKKNNKKIENIKQLIDDFITSQRGGGGFSTHTRSRIRNHRRTQYTNKHKRSSKSAKTTIKHRKSYRKHNRTIKRRKSRRHR